MNEQLIDTVISPVVDEQVTGLTALLNSLDIQMAKDIKTANELNAALSNSKSFIDYNTNATKTALQLEKIQQAQNKTAQTTVTLNEAQAKAAAAEQVRQDKALLALQKKQAAQATADAKEIAAAEAKAAKLQAIAAESARKAAVQFPASQSSPNPVTSEPDQPAIRYEPIITGNENMAISAAKSTEALAAETAAMLEQQEVLGSLTVAQRANLESSLVLQVELAAISAEMKTLNVEDAVSAERMAFLTAEQIRLKIAMREVTLELNNQTKEQLTQSGSVKQLTAALEILRNEYFELGTAERESEQGQKMLLNLQALDKEVKALRIATGDTSKEVGAYEKAIAKATSGTQLAATAVNVATRSLIRMLVQFAFIGVIIEAATWIYNYVKALEIFNDVATSSEIKQKALTDAFTSGDYEKGIENTEKLAANLDLAKRGIIDSDKAINEYNETIGKTFGYVTNLNDAQKGFVDHSEDYIQAIYLEAAAQAALANASKFAAEQLAKNVELQAEASNIKYDIAGAEKLGFSKKVIQNQKDQVKDLEKEIEDNNKRAIQSYKNTVNAIKDLYKSADEKTGSSSAGADPVNDLRTKIANEQLEHEKIIAQNKIANDKLSYKERLDAINDFYNASAKIEENNKNAELVKLPANDARREDIEKDAANKLLTLQEQTGNQRRQLLDKQYKQDQEIIKNNLQKQVDLFKQISDDPNQSYDMKLIALDIYSTKSLEIIDANYKEQVKEAGKNSESIKLAEQNKDKSILQLDNETAADRLKIQKENLAKILEQTKESEQEQLDALQNGANLAMRILTEAKDAKINALSLERANGKISEQKYNDEILAINDQYAIDRIRQEIATQQTILAIQEGRRDATVTRMRIDGASPDEISKFTSQSNKPIQATKDKIANLGDDLINATSKQTVDNTKSGDKDADARKKAEEFALEQTSKAIDEVDKLRQKAFEAEISRLEKVKQKIDENANNEKLQVQNSIASSATKAREIAVIDAQSLSAKKAIDAEIAKQKQKAAIADKEMSIAKIILSTAEAAIKAPAELGPILGLLAVPIVLALGAVELATAIAAPIPKFATGGTTRGGLAIWGEAGMERAVLPDGTVQYSSGPTVQNFPRGTVITPHMELMQQIKPAPVSYVGGEQVGWGEVVKQLKKMEPKQGRSRLNVNVDMGFETYKKSYLRR